MKETNNEDTLPSLSEANQHRINSWIEEIESKKCRSKAECKKGRVAEGEIKEEWRLVTGHSHLYASSTGRLMTPPRRDSRGCQIKGRLLRQQIMRSGYATASARFHGDARDLPYLVHRLICMAFHGGVPFKGAEARHLDGNKRNNTPKNLAWGTTRENALDKLSHGTMLRGEGVGNAKVSDRSALEIRTRYDAGESPTRIASDFGVTPSNVCHIGKRKTFKHLSETTAGYITPEVDRLPDALAVLHVA